MKPIKHGTLTGYNSRKCRCEACTAVMRGYKRAQRYLLQQAETPAHVHGTARGYNDYGCRCEPCRKAERVARNYPAYYAKNKDALNARRRGYYDSGNKEEVA